MLWALYTVSQSSVLTSSIRMILVFVTLLCKGNAFVRHVSTADLASVSKPHTIRSGARLALSVVDLSPIP